MKGKRGTGLSKEIDNSTFELIVMGYAKISPVRRLSASGRLPVFCTTLPYGALSAEEYLGTAKTRMTF